MKKLLMLIMLGAVLTAQSQNQKATLSLSANIRYQHIDGFGGAGMSGQWGDVYTDDRIRKLWGTGSDEVGLNIMRVRIAPDENDWNKSDAGYAKPIRTARRYNPGLTVFATPWTPPAKFKTQNTEAYKNDYGTWVYPQWLAWGFMPCGGAINPDCYVDYADFLERYRQMMEKHGARVDIISIQNESDYTPLGKDENGKDQASYESCIYSPHEMASMARAARAAIDPQCRIMGPECYGWDQHKYNNTLVNIPAAIDNIDLWGNHLYGTNDWSFVANVTAKTGRPMWMTEYYISYPESYTGAFSGEYPMIESLERAMAAGYSAYVYWDMTGDFFASSHGGSDKELGKRAYVFSHYTHYATGRQRIKSTLTDASKKLVGGSAYISNSGDTVSVFVLNTSDSRTYDLTVSLPFIPTSITQAATGTVGNCQKKDVSVRYLNGTHRPKVQLAPGVFYTFQFVHSEEQQPAAELATSPKKASQGNPLVADQFMADPTAVEYNGRLYIYATNDQQEYDFWDGFNGNTYGNISQLVCLSTNDMVNWTNHGIINVKKAAPWAWASWAPSIVSRVEDDGLTHFYLYFTTGGSSIGVLTSTSPTGPWRDPIGHALIDGSTPGLGIHGNLLDPGVAISDDGTEAYLTFGGGDPNSQGTNLQPGNTRIVRLGKDMVSLSGSAKRISSPYHFEANELNYIGGQWVFSYCTHWGSRDDWSSYGSKTNAPGTCSIVYMTASDPMADQWQYRGEILPNPGMLGYPWGNNHSHLHKYQGRYYIFYHTQWLENQLGIGGGYRGLNVSRLTVTESSATILPLTRAAAAISGLQQLSGVSVDPMEEHPATMAAVSTQDWWMVRGLVFPDNGDQEARSLILRVSGTGTLEVRPSSINAEPIATASFSSDSQQTVIVPLTRTITGTCRYLYFVKTAKLPDLKIQSWQFSSASAEKPSALYSPTAGSTAAPDYYAPTGIKVGTPQHGLIIERNADGKTIKRIFR